MGQNATLKRGGNSAEAGTRVAGAAWALLWLGLLAVQRTLNLKAIISS